MERAHLAQELRAGHVRHALIDEKERDGRAAALQFPGGLDRLRSRPRGQDAVRLAVAVPQIPIDRVQDFRIIVDRENDGFGALSMWIGRCVRRRRRCRARTRNLFRLVR
jgi:hypothetical protein